MAGMPVWLSTMLLGLGTVFVGLIVLIYIVKLSSVVIRAIEKKQVPSAEESAEAAPIQDRGALVAAVSACIAETMGRDVSGLRIVSLKRVG